MILTPGTKANFYLSGHKDAAGAELRVMRRKGEREDSICIYTFWYKSNELQTSFSSAQ